MIQHLLVLYIYICLEEVISWDIFSEGPLSELNAGNMAVYIYSELTDIYSELTDRMAKYQLHHSTFYSVTSTTSNTLHTDCRQI